MWAVWLSSSGCFHSIITQLGMNMWSCVPLLCVCACAWVGACVHDARRATVKESALQHVPLTVAVLQASAHPQFQNSSQNNRHGRSCSGLMSCDHPPSLPAQRPPPLTPSYAPLSSVTWPLGPPAAVRLFCADCCAGFFASIDRKAEGITFWNSAQGSLFHVPHAPGSHSLSLFPWGKADT